MLHFPEMIQDPTPQALHSPEVYKRINGSVNRNQHSVAYQNEIPNEEGTFCDFYIFSPPYKHYIVQKFGQKHRKITNKEDSCEDSYSNGNTPEVVVARHGTLCQGHDAQDNAYKYNH